MEDKLKIELVPDGCWKYNIRTVFSEEVWNAVKKVVKNRANGVCEICGAKSNRLEAHEIWEYTTDENFKLGVIKLKDVVAICKDCHSAIHMERTRLKGDIIKAEDHFMKVNDLTYAQYRQRLGKANEEQQRLSKTAEWVLNFENLKKILDIE